MILSISSFEIISAVPDPKLFFWLAASVADAGAVNPTGIKTLLANGLSTFSIKGKPVFRNRSRSLPRNPPNCNILDSWVLDHFIWAYKLFKMDLPSLH